MRVNMYRTSDSNNTLTVPAVWRVDDQNGNPISTVGSLTQGLQEAINYASFNGYDLRVHGGGIARKNGQDVAILDCWGPIIVPPLQGVDWRIHATINFRAAGAPYPVAIGFDSVMNSDIKFTGQIVCNPWIGAGVAIAPVNLLPNDVGAGPVITASRFDFHSIVKLGHDGCCVDLDARLGAITGNIFRFLEPNSGVTGVQARCSASKCFDSNDITVLECHGQYTGINAGCGPTGADNFRGNTWNVKVFPRNASCGIEVWGCYDHWFASIENREGHPVNGITLNTTARSNQFTVLRNQALNKVNNASPYYNSVSHIP